MGLAGLTAVFGMGTGVTPPVWSPEMCPAGGQAGRALGFRWLVAHGITDRDLNEWVLLHDSLSKSPYGVTRRSIDGLAVGSCLLREARGWQRPDRGGQAAWLLGPVG